MTARPPSIRLVPTLVSAVMLLALFAGCGPSEKEGNVQTSATPDLEATRVALVTEIVATITAQVVTTPRATETSGSTSVPTEISVPSPAMPAEPKPEATMTPIPPSTPVFTKSQKPEAIVKTEVLNVRAGPGTTHPVVDVVKQGDVLPVIARNRDASWLQIRLPSDEAGWVAAYLVDLNEYGHEVQVADTIPTPPPAPARPASAPKTLEVSFLNPHYECQQQEWSYTGDDGEHHPIWGYRSFQVDMYIKNNGSKPVTPPWRPTRWIITDGTADYVNGIIWQWVDPRTGFYEQPVIHPGESAGWTFLAFPIDRNQWLKAVEFTWNGQTYRQTFDLGPFGNAYNYKDCGDPRPHTFRPTPTPRP